jgi:hypothetical protein
MRLRLISFALGLLLVASSAARAQSAEEPLTNASVVKLARAGFKEKTIIAIIGARPVKFDLSPERLIELKKSGVTEHVILAMIARSESVDVSSGSWDDDEMPLGGGGMKGGGVQGADGGGTDIFGSSGGSHGRVRSRGTNGGTDNDTQTTGSASVHIIRTPTEGDAPAKLERTPTLTNDSIVELVEAGFSEGTIVRRIEQSPVEFDLSAAKLAELRKRRVSEPVIAAMRAAMGDDAGQPTHPEK